MDASILSIWESINGYEEKRATKRAFFASRHDLLFVWITRLVIKAGSVIYRVATLGAFFIVYLVAC